MYTEAYKDWIKIFDDNLLEVWQKERKELQKSAMLLCALQKELKDVQMTVEVELINLRQQLNHKDLLEEKRKCLSPKSKLTKKYSPVNKENKNSLILNISGVMPSEDIFPEKKSPDLFRNRDLNVQPSSSETSIIDLSLSDEDTTKLDESPTIKRRRKHHGRCKPSSEIFQCDVNSDSNVPVNTPTNNIQCKKSIKTNLFKTPALKSDDDFSVIENTPEVKSKSFNTAAKSRQILSKKARKANTTNTLTQMYGRPKEKLQLANKETEDDIDSDETYFEDTTEGSKMGITEMISYINKDEVFNFKQKLSTPDRADESIYSDPSIDSSGQEVDEFSKGAIFNEADIETSNEKPKVVPVEPEVVVRGKARKQLQGWACDKCKKFYASMKLTPEELQKKMDECSRHRYKYRPPDETLPGFWDLSIPPEEPVQKQ